MTQKPRSNITIPTHVLPERWREAAFVAGGYAADPTLADDIDLWVTVPSNWELNGAREEILEHLTAKHFRFYALDDRRTNSGVHVEQQYHVTLDYRKVAKVTGREGNWPFRKPVHVMVTNGSPLETLLDFDISTHQVAVLRSGRILPGPDWTPTSVMPVKLKDTPTTDARMKKIADRYAHLRLPPWQSPRLGPATPFGVVPVDSEYPF